MTPNNVPFQYADIPHPRLELHTHVLCKNIQVRLYHWNIHDEDKSDSMLHCQVGLVLGMGVIGPLVGLIRGRSITAALTSAYMVCVTLMAPAMLIDWLILILIAARIVPKLKLTPQGFYFWKF